MRDRQNRKAKQAGDKTVGTLTAVAVNDSGDVLHPVLAHHVLALVPALPFPALALSKMLEDRSLNVYSMKIYQKKGIFIYMQLCVYVYI